jgi:hypothetical protein
MKFVSSHGRCKDMLGSDARGRAMLGPRGGLCAVGVAVSRVALCLPAPLPAPALPMCITSAARAQGVGSNPKVPPSFAASADADDGRGVAGGDVAARRALARALGRLAKEGGGWWTDGMRERTRNAQKGAGGGRV